MMANRLIKRRTLKYLSYIDMMILHLPFNFKYCHYYLKLWYKKILKLIKSVNLLNNLFLFPVTYVFICIIYNYVLI